MGRKLGFMGRKLVAFLVSIWMQQLVLRDKIRRVSAEHLLKAANTRLKTLTTFCGVVTSASTEFWHRPAERILLRLEHKFECIDM